MKRVLVIVVTYNRKELLFECIEALLNQSYKNIQILIIDNCSTDGTREAIDVYINNGSVIYKNTGKNIGGAGGFNYGLKEASKYDCDYFWLMDDDCIVHNDTLTELIDFASQKKDKFGFLSSVVLWSDDSICKMNIQKTSILKHVKDFNSETKLKFATFVSFFVKKSVVERVGLPIKEFFIWGDDLEYSQRISKDYYCYLVPTSKVTHKSKDNIGSNIAEDTSENLERYKYAYRNEKYLYDRMGLKAKLFYFIKIRLHMFRILKSNVSNKKMRISLIRKSVKEGKKFNPTIEYVTRNLIGE